MEKKIFIRTTDKGTNMGIQMYSLILFYLMDVNNLKKLNTLDEMKDDALQMLKNMRDGLKNKKDETLSEKDRKKALTYANETIKIVEKSWKKRAM